MILLTKRFGDAVTYACAAHAQQIRKGTAIPYVAHLLGVASIALEFGGNEDEAVGAILHDVVEDCGGKPRLEEVRSMFGATVATIVEGCTDTDVPPKTSWQVRKETYINHLAHASASTRLVAASDKLYNARAIIHDLRIIGDKVWSRFTGDKAGSLWYYRALVDAFKAHGSNALIKELDRVVTEMEQLASNDL